MPKFTINVISGDRALDRLMHAADLFESFKRLGNCWSVEVECVDPKTVVDRLVGSFDGQNDQILTAVWCAERPEVRWIDWSVKAVSNGQQWFVLETYLKQFGITNTDAVRLVEETVLKTAGVL